MNDRAIFEAVGEILKAELSARDAKIEALSEQQKSLLSEAVSKAVSSDDFLSRIKGENGASGIGIKAIEQLEDRRSFSLILDNDQETVIELPEPLQGEQGLPGEKGQDGLDRPLAQVRKAAANLESNEVVHFAGGLYQTTKKTVGDPQEDPGAYRLLLNGVEKAEFSNDEERRKHLLQLRMTDGSAETLEIEQAAGFIDPAACTVFKDGDYYIEGTKFCLYRNDEWEQIEMRGRRGRMGPAGRGVKEVRAINDGFEVEMTDGKSYAFPIVEKVLELLVTDYKEVLIDLTMPVIEDISQEIRRYAGVWIADKTYAKGDVVTTYQGLYLALKSTKQPVEVKTDWAFMLGINASGGGGGGGGTGLARTSTIIADGALQMGGFAIQGLKDPRTGDTGKADAVTRDFMDKAIAAGALYQGIYTVAINTPDLAAKTDSGFVAPAANAIINAPTGATAAPAAGNVLVWFDLRNSAMHLKNFPYTAAGPINFELRLSNGKIHTFSLPAGTYNTWGDAETALITEIRKEAAVQAVEMTHDATNLYVGIHTTPPIYATYMSGQVASPFAAAVIGPANSQLNTYNYVVQTANPNVDEALPPGIPGIEAGTKVSNSDVLQYSSAKQGFEIISGSSLTQNFSDQRYWQVNGKNMHWQDQPYNKDSIVYVDSNNQWFIATQDVPTGTAEPGQAAAAPFWRQINAKGAGATIYMGRGLYDATDTTAANNWGMPIGTSPASIAPSDGDSYFDIRSGQNVHFTVTAQPAEYFQRGTVNPASATNIDGSDAQVITDILNWPPAYAAGATKNQAWKISPNFITDWTVASGPFTNKQLKAGRDYYIVYSGDPAAQGNGWMILDATVAGWETWALPTPNPQPVASVVTPTIDWGTAREFGVTIGATAAEDDNIILLWDLPVLSNYVSEVTIYDAAPDGANYRFLISTSQSDAVILTPISVDAHNSHIKRINVSYDATYRGNISVTLDAGAAGTTYALIIESYQMPLASLKAGDGTQKETVSTTSFNAAVDYPGTDLTRSLRAASGDGEASLPLATMKLGDNATGLNIPLTDGRIYRFRGYCFHTGGFVPRLYFEDSTGPIADAAFHGDYYGQATANGAQANDAGKWTDWPWASIQSLGTGYMPCSPAQMMDGTTMHAEVSVDLRDPDRAFISMESYGYRKSDSWRLYSVWKCYITNPNRPTLMRFTAADTVNTQWRVYVD